MGAGPNNEQLLMQFGLDLKPLKTAGADIESLLKSLNVIAANINTTATAANKVQLQQGKDAKVIAEAAIAAAKAAVAGEKLKQEAVKTGTIELKKQTAEQQLIGLHTKNATAEEIKKKAAISASTAEIQKQRAEIAKETAEIQKQTAELRKHKLEHGGGGHGGGEHEQHGIIRSLLTGATSGLLGGGLAGRIAGGVVTGQLAFQGIRIAEEAVEHFLERLKELTVEASQATRTQAVFEKLTKAKGIDADKFMAGMQQSVQGEVARQDLRKVAVAALSNAYKLTEKQLTDAVGDIVKLSDAYGKNGTANIQRFARMLEMGRINARSLQINIPQQSLIEKNLPQGLSETEKKARQVVHALEVIHERAKSLGEIPETLEEMEDRVKAAKKDAFEAFGIGFNRSAGVQVLIETISGLTTKSRSFYDSLVQIGVKVGDFFAVIAAGIQTGLPLLRSFVNVFQDLIGIGANLLNVTGSLLGIANATDHIGSSADSATGKLKEMDPALFGMISSVVSLNTQFQMVGVIIEEVIHKIRELTSLTPAAAMGLGAIVGGRFGGIPGAIAGGVIGGAGAGISEGINAPITIPSGVHTRHSPWFATDKLRSLYESLKLSGHIALKAYSGKLTDVPPSAGAGKEDESLEGRFAKIRAASKETLEEISKNILHARELLAKGYGPMEDTKTQEDANRQEALKKIDLETKYQNDVAKLRHDKARLAIDQRAADLDEEKQLDKDAYKDGEQSLVQHLANQATLLDKANNLQRDKTRLDYEEKATELQRQATALIAKQKITGAPVEDTRKQLASISLEIQKARVDMEDRLTGLDKQHFRQLHQLAVEGTADISAATKGAAKERLATEVDTIHQEQAAVEGSLRQRLTSYQDYYQKRQDLIRRQREASVRGAFLSFTEGPDNQQRRQELANSIAKAQRDAQDASDKLIAENPEGRLHDIQERSGVRKRGIQGSIDLNKEAGNADEVLALHKELVNELQQESEALNNLLPALTQGSAVYSDTKLAIQGVTKELQAQGSQWTALTDKMKHVGGIGSTLSTGLTSVFTSKFAQDLGSQVQRGSDEISKSKERGNILSAPTKGLEAFGGKVNAAVGALSGFISTLGSSKSAISGGVGGAMSGFGFGDTVSKAFGMAGPWGAVAGGVIGATLGAVMGDKQAKVQANITHLNESFKSIMNEFDRNTNNLQSTINQMSGLVQQARQMQANSKKGGAQYQQVIDKYNDQLMQLQNQQYQLIRNLNEQLAMLRAPVGMQDFLSSLKDIIKQYQQFEGAAQNANDLAQANEFLSLSLEKYTRGLDQQLLQDNQQAINDALQLNDLLYQRQQFLLNMNSQISQALSQGVLTRQQTFAQTKAQQVYQIQLDSQRQLDQMNEQIAATQYKVDAEKTVFNLATTRIGLEFQLLGVQKAQTNLDMQRITALGALVSALASGNTDFGPIRDLLNAMPGVYNPVGSGSSVLDQLIAAAYQDRSNLGYGSFKAANL